MIRPQCLSARRRTSAALSVFAVSLIASSLCGRAAFAQPAPGSGTSSPAPGATTTPSAPTILPIPAATKTSPTISPSDPTIAAFINANVQLLAGADPTQRTNARNALANAPTAQGLQQGQTVSPAFLFAYAGALNTALKPLANHSSAQVRLNVAITAERVAELANNAQLADLAVLLLQDKNPGVVMWAMRIARWTLPSALVVNAKAPLLAAIVPAAQAHPTGDIAREAYAALMLDYAGPTSAQIPAPAWANIVKVAVDEVLKLMRFRLDQYLKGVPQDPQAERLPVLFLTHNRIWPNQTADQHKQSIQAIVDLLILAGHQADASTAAQDRAQLLDLVKYICKSLSVVSTLNGQPFKAAVANVANLGGNAKIGPVVQEVQDAARLEMPGLTPTTMPTAAPAPGSTTAPSTPAAPATPITTAPSH